jgi:hypothetical protein
VAGDDGLRGEAGVVVDAVTVGLKVPALTSIMSSIRARTLSVPVWSPEKRFTPGSCQITLGLSPLSVVGTSPLLSPPK